MENSSRRVWIGQCIRTIIFSLVVLCTAFIPFSFNGGTVLTYTKLPVIGDSTILAYSAKAAQGLQTLIGIPAEFMKYINYAYEYYLYGFYGILLADILFSLILILTRLNALRILFKFFSVIFGIAMLVLMIVNLGYTVGILYLYVINAGFDQILTVILGEGIIYALALTLFSGIFIKRQFVWFAADY